MKNIFIITLGTREVQLRKSKLSNHGFVVSSDEKQIAHRDLPDMNLSVYENHNFPDFYCCAEPRVSGNIILENWDYLKKVIEFPLIEQALDTIISGHTIHELILVYTDQKDIDTTNKKSLTHFNSDTISFRNIFRRQLLELYPSLPNNPASDIAVTEKTADIDFQYRNFAITCKALYELEPEILQVFLLAQGGIDQINHALTLQLIQAFGSKVKLWQQAEGNEPRSLTFPFLFIQDLNKQKLIKHISDYDFGFINKNLTTNKLIVHLAQYSSARLQIKHDTVKCNLDYLKDKVDPDFYRMLQIDPAHFKDLQRLQDLYISSKISLLHDNYSDFVWRLFTISENLFQVRLEKDLPDSRRFFNPNISNNQTNESWIAALIKISPNLPDILRNKGVYLNNPNRKAMFEIFCYIEINKGNTSIQKFRKIFNVMENMALQRNRLAHNLQPVKKESLIQVLGQDYGLKGLTDDLDLILNIKEYGIFDDIRKAMMNMAN
jgi:hypothetical protein